MKRAIVLSFILILVLMIVNCLFVYNVSAEQTLPWGVDRIDADKAWSITKGRTANGTPIKIAILETGIDKTHPDLVGQTQGINFLGVGWPGDDSFDDHHGHGTAMAGIIAANDNNIGVVGVAPEAIVYTVKIREELGILPDNYPNHGNTYNFTDLCNGMRWCIENGIQVINFSLGLVTIKYDENGQPQADHPLHDSDFYYWIREASARNIIMVAAAGNQGRKIQKYNNPPIDADYEDTNDIYQIPGSYPQVIAVSATGIKTVGKKTTDYVPSWSNWGPAIELSAPGDAIYTTYLGGYNTNGGTSRSAPHVVGVAALLLANGVPANQVRARLQATAEDLGKRGRDDYYGYGLVDAGYAIVGQRAPARPGIVSPTNKVCETWGKIKGDLIR